MTLNSADDYFHVPTTDERWWSETYWFSFDDPATGLSGTFYPLLRKNLDIAALTVAVWAPNEATSWTAPYCRSYWHLKPPVFEGNTMALEGLTYEILDPLHRYHVTYQDPNVFTADLTVTGLADNYVPIATPERGHWDQPTRVVGSLNFAGREIPIDGFGMRDRSWGPRLDSNTARTSYVYGINDDASFLVVSQMQQDPHTISGYLDQDGERSRIVTAEQFIERDSSQRVSRVTLEGSDQSGRNFSITGRARNHLAKQASPGYFAWMSMFEWDFADGAVGQYQDVWSPDLLSIEASRLLM